VGIDLDNVRSRAPTLSLALRSFARLSARDIELVQRHLQLMIMILILMMTVITKDPRGDY